MLIGICTHLGCLPKQRFDKGELYPSWPGGFFCPCHGSRFDLAGRVFDGSPASINLNVPPLLLSERAHARGRRGRERNRLMSVKTASGAPAGPASADTGQRPGRACGRG